MRMTGNTILCGILLLALFGLGGQYAHAIPQTITISGIVDHVDPAPPYGPREVEWRIEFYDSPTTGLLIGYTGGQIEIQSDGIFNIQFVPRQ